MITDQPKNLSILMNVRISNEGDEMKLRAILYVLILAVITSSAVNAETMKNVPSGATSVDLGGGYQMSFVLDDSFESYDIEIIAPSKTVIGEKYELVVYQAGSSDILIDMWVHIWPWEEHYSKNSFDEAKTETSYGYTTQRVPRTIDGSFGKIIYGYYGDEADGADFAYLPGGVVTSDGRDIISKVEVEGRTSDAHVLPIFDAIVDSIHVSGPAIK